MGRKPITFTVNKEPFAFMRTARELVVDYVHRKFHLLGNPNFTVENVNIIWFTANDHDWRVLLGTTLQDGLYYRITHFGIETRLEVFEMVDQEIILNEESV
jgi:hypothetical protein